MSAMNEQKEMKAQVKKYQADANLTSTESVALEHRDPPGVETRAAKRPRKEISKEHHNQLQQSGAFAILTDDALLTPIFEFLGLYEYRFVAILSKRFRRLYSDFQERKIRQAPVVPSIPRPVCYFEMHQYVSTSLTSTASVAESIGRAKVLMSDMANTGSKHVIKLRKLERDGPLYGYLYDMVYHGGISDDLVQIKLFLRDSVAVRYGNFGDLAVAPCEWLLVE